jgi:hypothetical protein
LDRGNIAETQHNGCLNVMGFAIALPILRIDRL